MNDPVRGRLRVVWDEDKDYVRVSRNDVRDADGTGNAVFYHQHTRTSPSGVTTVSGQNNKQQLVHVVKER